MSCFLFTKYLFTLITDRIRFGTHFLPGKIANPAFFSFLQPLLPSLGHGCATLMAQLCHTDGTALPLGWHDCAIKAKIIGTIYL
jgi:hypothetical protein